MDTSAPRPALRRGARTRVTDVVRRRTADTAAGPGGGPQDAGFTLVELIVAMVITLIVITALIGVFVSSLTGVALAKQRQAATSLATGVMEQIRALDYGTLSAGMPCSDLAGDPRITVSGTCGAGGTATLTPGIASISETLKVQLSTPATNVAPIYPHRTTKTIDEVAYQVSAYVTTAATTQQAFNLTVLVEWSSAVSKGSKTVIQRSLSYSPTRCLSSATHPYSGACQAAFRGDAGLTNAGISIVNPDGGVLQGLSGTEVSLTMPTLSTTTGTEQISKLSGAIGTMVGAVLDGATQTSQSGGDVGTTAADTDPSSVDAGSGTDSVAQPSLTAATAAGTAGELRVLPTSADDGTVTATTLTPASTCLDSAAQPLPATSQACTQAVVQSKGASGRVVLALNDGAPQVTVLSLGAAPAVSRATVARLSSAGTTACPTAAGLGCVTSQVSRALGDLSLGGLPTTGNVVSQPSGWPGQLLTVTGVRESAYADAGIGARATPGFSRTAGTLTWFDATTGLVQTRLLKDLAADLKDVPLGPIVGEYVQGGHTVRVTMSGSLTAGGTALLPGSVTAPDPLCKTAACDRVASVASTLTANVRYDVVVDGLTTTRFAVVVDLGSVLARSSYKAAFDG